MKATYVKVVNPMNLPVRKDLDQENNNPIQYLCQQKYVEKKKVGK